MKQLTPIFSVLILSASVVAAEDKARAIVEKAIQAQGGAAKVAKLKTMRIKAEGTAAVVPGQPDLPFTIEDIWQMPDRYKTTSTFQIAGNSVVQTQAIVGDKGWMQMNGQAQEMPKEAIAEMKEQKYAEDLDRCTFLKEPGFELSMLSTIQIFGKPAIGVLVKSNGHRDVKLWFDSANGLLVRREHRLLDPGSGQEVLQKILFSDYQDKDGLKHYRKITMLRDGKKTLEARITDIEFLDRVDGKVFAKP